MPFKGISADGFLAPSRKHNTSSALTRYAAILVMLLPNSHAIDVTAAGDDDHLRCAAGHINQDFLLA